MKTPRLKQLLLPLVAAQGWRAWAVAPKYANELRLLNRRVAGARLGEGLMQWRVRQQPYDDLQ